MEDILIMNKLPLPKYYDGEEWQTVSRPKRSSIPKYLHDQLPELKHLYIKRLFQEIGKINCPGLEYFHSLIKMRKTKSTPRRNNESDHARQVKEKLQYALITTDRNSNIVEQLVEEAKTTKVATSRRRKSQSLNKSDLKGGYRNFDNTVQLVFRNRKKLLLSQKQPPLNQKTAEAFERVQKIELLPYNK